MGVYPDPRQVVFFAFRSFEECSKVDKEGNFVDHMPSPREEVPVHAEEIFQAAVVISKAHEIDASDVLGDCEA
ncbi:hypothetical protein LguiB_031347 [Lonicera macranthoides]